MAQIGYLEGGRLALAQIKKSP